MAASIFATSNFLISMTAAITRSAFFRSVPFSARIAAAGTTCQDRP
jgi:hypothetical protein